MNSWNKETPGSWYSQFTAGSKVSKCLRPSLLSVGITSTLTSVLHTCPLPVLLCGLQRRACGCGPVGFPSSLERAGPPDPHIPLPPLGSVGRPQLQEHTQQGAALQGGQRGGPELRDQSIRQGFGGWLLSESALSPGPAEHWC